MIQAGALILWYARQASCAGGLGQHSVELGPRERTILKCDIMDGIGLPRRHPAFPGFCCARVGSDETAVHVCLENANKRASGS